MRWVIARVLPVPAPASTQTGPRRAVATSRCSGSSPASTASAEAAPGSTVVAVIAGILAAAADTAIANREPAVDGGAGTGSLGTVTALNGSFNTERVDPARS